jgi:hypothetical protein
MRDDDDEASVAVVTVDEITLYCVKAPWVDRAGSEDRIGTLAITQKQLGAYATMGLTSGLAQFQRIVAPGIILARHIFRGLMRPMSVGGNMCADRDKLVYSWKPRFDYEWPGDRFKYPPVELEPPAGRVFVVLVTPNSSDQFPMVDGWIERWNWVLGSDDLFAAPIKHSERYEEQLWRAT